MLPLRYPRFWLALGWLLVAGVILGSLLPGPVIQEITPALNDKLMHFTAYFVLMVWFAGLYPHAKHVRVGLALLALGAALDILQGVATRTRSFELLDIAADGVGILAALLLSAWFLEGWCLRVERLAVRSA
ncbi:MAG TPA: VanZ family protein [Gammaproteobacteria bacterium]|nr:VanZ family protein [Gammaproteobacteria bacterium]